MNGGLRERVGAAACGASSSSRICGEGSVWVAMVNNSIGCHPGVSDFLFAFVADRVARFAVTHERGCRMPFMRRAHAGEYFYRAECKPRTIVRQMHNNATSVTQMNRDGHTADTGFACGRCSDRSRRPSGMALRAAGQSHSLEGKREAVRPLATL